MSDKEALKASVLACGCQPYGDRRCSEAERLHDRFVQEHRRILLGIGDFDAKDDAHAAYNQHFLESDRTKP